jgi:hypothetical protein
MRLAQQKRRLHKACLIMPQTRRQMQRASEPLLATPTLLLILAWELAQAMLAQAKLMVGCCVNELAALQLWLAAGILTLATTLMAAGCSKAPAMVCLTPSPP